MKKSGNLKFIYISFQLKARFEGIYLNKKQRKKFELMNVFSQSIRHILPYIFLFGKSSFFFYATFNNRTKSCKIFSPWSHICRSSATLDLELCGNEVCEIIATKYDEHTAKTKLAWAIFLAGILGTHQHHRVSALQKWKQGTYRQR